MFVADVKCSQATWHTVPNSQTGSAKASVSEAAVSQTLSEEDRRDRRLPSETSQAAKKLLEQFPEEQKCTFLRPTLITEPVIIINQ